MSTFLADMVKKGYTEDEVFGVLFESQRGRRRQRLQAIVVEEVVAHNLKKMNELLTHQELVIWRRENGFDRVAEGEESRFYGHRSLPPTPQEYYASLWCEVNAFFFFFFFFHLTYRRWTSSLPSCLWSQRIFPSLPGSSLRIFYRDASSALLQLVNQWLNLKDAISMPAWTPWQRTTELVDGLKGKLPDLELAKIKRYVEPRCREEAVAQMTVTPVDTVQHCSPISQTSVPPSGVCFNLENEGRMDPELEKLKSSSAGTGLNTPGQLCPPNKGIRETGRTTASGTLTAGASSSKKRNISTSTGTVASISSTAATPGYRRLKTFSEENKQFDPGGQREKAPPWDAAVTLPFFFGGELGSSVLLSVCASRSVLSVCLFS